MDLNADLGEGFGVWTLGDDEALLDLVTSANVACGFHGGDPSIMRSVCAAAADRGVAIGAQVGYRDLAGFGRRRIEYRREELRDEVIYQIAALDGFARVAGDRVRYVKPHGALYNTAAVDEVQAGAVIDAITDYDAGLPVLCQPGSVLARLAAESGLRVVGEGFADRAYQPDGRLVPRTSPDAVIHHSAAVADRVVRMALDRTVVAVDGTVVPCDVESICLHGDTAGAVDLARRVRASLLDADLTLTSFA